MKQFKAALFLSLGLISINAWSIAAEKSQQSVDPVTTEIYSSPVALLALGGFALLCLVVLLKQRNTIKTLKKQSSILEKSNAELKTLIAEQNKTIENAKTSSQPSSSSGKQSNANISSQNPTQKLDSGHKFDEALIDISIGIKKVRGKEDRYQSLLDDFITRDPSIVNRLTEYIGKSQMLLAKDFAQSMKEETGDLALDSLHFCLQDLEHALIEDDLTATHQKLVDLGRAWRITEREVQKYLHLKTA